MIINELGGEVWQATSCALLMKTLTLFFFLLFFISCDCINRGNEITEFVYNTPVPFGEQLTYRNDSLVISNCYTEYDEKLESFNSYLKTHPNGFNDSLNFLIDMKTGKFLDTIKDFKPNYNRGQVDAAFFSVDTNIIEKFSVSVHRLLIKREFHNYNIYLEWWEPHLRCPGEHRIAFYKGDKNIINYKFIRGVSDYLIVGDEIFILSSDSEWPDRDGRHLARINLNSLIKKI